MALARSPDLTSTTHQKTQTKYFILRKHFDQPSQYKSQALWILITPKCQNCHRYLLQVSSLQQSGSESESDRETTIRAIERKLIQKYTPKPDGSLDGSFDISEIDDNLFEDFCVPPLHEDVDIASLDIHSYAEERAQVPNQEEDSFNVDNYLGLPRDDYEREYLNSLL